MFQRRQKQHALSRLRCWLRPSVMLMLAFMMIVGTALLLHRKASIRRQPQKHHLPHAGEQSHRRQHRLNVEQSWEALISSAMMTVRAQDAARRNKQAAMVASGVSDHVYGVTTCPMEAIAEWAHPSPDQFRDSLSSRMKATSTFRSMLPWMAPSQDSVLRDNFYVPFDLGIRDLGLPTTSTSRHQFLLNASQEDDGIGLLTMKVTNPQCGATGFWVAPCSERESFVEPSIREATNSYWVAPGQQYVHILVNRRKLIDDPRFSNICFALWCPEACTQWARKEPYCKERTSLTAPLTTTPREKERMFARHAQLSSTSVPSGQEILIVLLESLSWRDFNATFHRTQEYLDELDETSGTHRVSRYVNAHANGQYTSLNHPPLLFGSHMEVCATHKGFVIAKPCDSASFISDVVQRVTTNGVGPLQAMLEKFSQSTQVKKTQEQLEGCHSGIKEATIDMKWGLSFDPTTKSGLLQQESATHYNNSLHDCNDLSFPIHETQLGTNPADMTERLRYRNVHHPDMDNKPRHLLRLAKNHGFKTGFLAPLILVDNVVTCYEVADESDLNHHTVDDFRWRYFDVVSWNAPVHNKSQGCAGDRHEMDYQDEFIHSFFDDPNTSGYSKQQSKIAVLNHQVSHAGMTDELGRYYDARLEQQVRHFIENAPEGVQRTVLLQADHGPSARADRHILNPVSIWITPRTGPFWERNGPVLHRRRHAVTSHFDEYATLLDFLERYPFDGKPEQKEDPTPPVMPPRQVNCKANAMRHRLSMLDATIDVPLRRSCEDLGLFSHSCNLFDEVEVVGGGNVIGERLRAGLVHLLTKRAAGYVSSMFAAPVATRHKSSDDDGAGREHFGPCQNLPQMMVSASTKPEAERFVEFESVSARLFSDGTCALAGRVALATKPRRSVFIFNVEPIVSLVEDGMSVEERARRCVTAFVRHRRKRVTQMIRVSRFAPDEDACGSKLESFWASLRAAATGKAKAPHMMYCVCDVRE